jgi:hypothetical protein
MAKNAISRLWLRDLTFRIRVAFAELLPHGMQLC